MATSMKEDVYESENPLTEADRDQKYFRDDIVYPEELQLVHLDIDAALKRFQGRLLSAQDVDFSDSISPYGKKSYGSTAYVLEVIGKNTSDLETFEEKFNRLYLEIGQLAETAARENNTNSKAEKSTNVLQEMLNEVKELKSASNALKSEITLKAPSTSSSITAENNKSLDKRIERVEALLGSLPSGTQPIVDAIEDLRLRTDVINPVFLDTADTKLSAILAKQKAVDEKKSGNEEFEQNINNLLTLMNKWDGVCTNLPSQSKKLNSLSRLHENAQQFSERLSRLSTTREMIEKEIALNRSNLDFIHTLAKNEVADLVGKIEKLEGQLKKLGK